MNRLTKRTYRKRLIATAFLLFFFLPNSFLQALPEGAEVISGEASLEQPNENTLNVTASDQSIIQWNSFNVASNQTVNFFLPTVDANSLNRIVGGTPTEIQGTLTANGTIFLINTQGILFGPTAALNVGGLIASTRDIGNQAFLNGQYLFGSIDQAVQNVSSAIVNQGTILTREGGFAVLLGSAVKNEALISAPLGTAALVSGNVITVGISANGAISIGIDQETSQQVLDANGNPIADQIKQSGEMNAGGGTVIMKAKAAQGLFDLAVNQTGIVRANSVVVGEGGSVEITGQGNPVAISGTLEADQGEVQVSTDKMLTVAAETITKGNTTFEAEDNLEVNADITTTSGNLTLKADSDLNGIGSFLQTAGTTLKTITPSPSPLPLGGEGLGEGDITIFSSGESTLANIISAGNLILNQAGAVVTYTQQANSTITAGASLTIGAGVTLKAANALYQIAQDWINLGSFVAQTSLVKLTGLLDGHVQGSNTFNDFMVIEPSKTVIFDSGATQDITGILTLRGEFGKLIILRSLNPDIPWNINPTGIRDVSFVDVRNSTNVNIHGPPIETLHSKNSLGNTGWDFSNGPIWTGASSLNWSDSLNWDGGFVPGPGDVVILSAAKDLDSSASPQNDSVVDPLFQGTIAGLNLDSSYASTLTLNRSLTVTGDVTLAGGTLSAGSHTLTVSGDWNLTSGTFQAGTSTVVFNDASQISNITGNNTFYNLTIVTPGKALIFETNTMTTIQGTLTVEGAEGNLVSFTSSVAGEGNEFDMWIANVSDAQGNAYLDYFTVTHGDAFGPLVPIPAQHVIIGINSRNWDPNLSGTVYRSDGITAIGVSDIYVWIAINGVVQATAMAVTAGTGAFGATNYAYASGDVIIAFLGGSNVDSTVAPPSNAICGGTACVGNYITNTDGAAITDITFVQGSIVIDSNNGATGINVTNFAPYDNGENATNMLYTISGPGDSTFTSESTRGVVVYSAGIFAPGASTTVDISTNLTINGTLTGNTATIIGGGDVTINGTWTGSGNVTYIGGDITGNGDITYTGGEFLIDGDGNFGGNTDWDFYNLTAGGAGGPTTTTKTGSNSIIVANDLTIAASQNLNMGDDTWTVAGDLIANGSITAGTGTVTINGGAVTGNGDITLTGGTFTLTGTGDFGGTSNWDFNNLTFGAGAAGTTTKISSGTVTAAGDLTIAANHNLNMGDDSWTITGDAVITGNISAGTGTVTINGGAVTGNGDITLTGGTFTLTGTGNFGGNTNWDFNNLTFGAGAAGTTTKTGSGTITAANDLTIAASQNLDMGDDTWTVTGDAVITGNISAGTGNVTVNGGAVTGNGDITLTDGNFTVTGTGNFGGNTNWDFNDLTFGAGAAGTTTKTGSGSITLADDFSIAANHTLDAGDDTWNVAGDWTNSGTFTATSSTVTLNGGNQAVSGSTTFWILTKTVTTARTLTFQAGSTQTISGTLMLQGAARTLLTLVSGTPGTAWSINPQGTRTVSYLNVQDSTNSNATAISCLTGCVDSSRNINWLFPTASPTPDPIIPPIIGIIPPVDIPGSDDETTIEIGTPPPPSDVPSPNPDKKNPEPAVKDDDSTWKFYWEKKKGESKTEVTVYEGLVHVTTFDAQGNIIGQAFVGKNQKITIYSNQVPKAPRNFLRIFFEKAAFTEVGHSIQRIRHAKNRLEEVLAKDRVRFKIDS